MKPSTKIQIRHHIHPRHPRTVEVRAHRQRSHQRGPLRSRPDGRLRTRWGRDLARELKGSQAYPKLLCLLEMYELRYFQSCAWRARVKNQVHRMRRER